MGLRSGIRATFWFSLGLLGAATILVTYYQSFDAAMGSKPHRIPFGQWAGFALQSMVGAALLAAPIVRWLITRGKPLGLAARAALIVAAAVVILAVIQILGR
jgi:hypothetical protein